MNKMQTLSKNQQIIFDLIDCLILNKESMNKNKAAAIIEGPDAVLNSNEENNPKITDNNPPMIE